MRSVILLFCLFVNVSAFSSCDLDNLKAKALEIPIYQLIGEDYVKMTPLRVIGNYVEEEARFFIVQDLIGNNGFVELQTTNLAIYTVDSECNLYRGDKSYLLR